MIIDFHTHIFPPFFSDNRDRLILEEPAFGHLYASPNARFVGREALLENMDEEGVHRSVIFGFPWEDPAHFCRHNDYIIESIQQHPNRFVGFCCFSPLSAEGPREAVRCLEAGLSGVGEIAVYRSAFPESHAPALRELMEICSSYDVPILLHSNEPVGHFYPGKTPMTLRDIYGFIKAYPSNRIVLAHWGGGLFFYALMKKEVGEVLKNTWFDTAASPYLYIPDIYRIAGDIMGFEKILFGSDYPLLRPSRYFHEMRLADLPPQAIEKIMGENAAKLLRLSC